MMSEFDGLSGLSTVSNLIGQQQLNSNPNPGLVPLKKKRNLPGTPDPDAEVIAMSPKSLMAKNRFICEICNKGFQRDQNLQLHRRGHNLPWKLRQRTSKELVRKKVYVCPEKSCVHHDPARALGDLTGIKKHYSRKHGEKKWKCEKCSKKYAVQSDWKAHSKICGTKEYKCGCGTLFSRKDSFITHRAFCDALAEENSRIITSISTSNLHPTFKNNPTTITHHFSPPSSSSSSLLFQPNFPVAVATAADQTSLVGHNFPTVFSDHVDDHKPRPLPPTSTQLPLWLDPPPNFNPFFSAASHGFSDHPLFLLENHHPFLSESLTTASTYAAAPHMSATALLQKAAQMGPSGTPAPPPILFDTTATAVYGMNNNSAAVLADGCPMMRPLMGGAREEIGGQNLTRDFLGVGNQLVHITPVGYYQYSDQSRRH